MEYFLILSALFLAYSNGANDNFKGFATVWGSQTLSYRTALTLATVATITGSLFSLLLADTLVQQFSGKGLVPDAVAVAPLFILAVGVGAAITVISATRSGLPVSTTHALIGGLIGAGLGANHGEIHLDNLATVFLLPLLVSPLLAAALGWLAYRFIPQLPQQNDCACFVPAVSDIDAEKFGTAVMKTTAPTVVVASVETCATLAQPHSMFSLTRMRDHVHTFSATLICFARGVNDTPKLAALLLAAHMIKDTVSIWMIAMSMAVGGLLQARRVAQTMALRMTQITHNQGLTANLITATLVLFASKLGVPVSTTHVSVGSIAGVGAVAGGLNWHTIRNIVLSWVATLPMAAAAAWLAFKLFS